MSCCGHNKPTVEVPNPMDALKQLWVCQAYGSADACNMPLTPKGIEPMYSFESEFVQSTLHKSDTSSPTSPCMGVISKEMMSLYGSPPFGNPTPKQLSELMNEGTIHASGFHALRDMISKCSGLAELQDLIHRHGVKWYVGNYNCVRSVFCTGMAIKGGLCSACMMVKSDARVTKRAVMKAENLSKYVASRPQWEDMSFVRNKDLVHSQLHLKLDLAAEETYRLRVKHKGMDKRMATTCDMLNNAKSRLLMLSQREEDIPEFLSVLHDAHHDGVLQSKGALVELLQAVADAMKSGRRHRRLTPVMQAFYSKLLVHGGQQVHDFVSSVLLGPDVRTTRRLTKGPMSEFMLGIKSEFFKEVRKLMCHWGIQDAPVFIGEDATALQPRLDTLVEGDHLYVMGFTGGKLEIKSKADLMHINNSNNLATSFYLFVVIPLVPGAPFIPLFVQLHDGTKNTFNCESITHTWHEVQNMARKEGMNLMGHVGDGDPRYRKAVYGMMMREVPSPAMAISVNHPFIQLVAPKVFNGDNHSFITTTIDYLHICWRLRVQGLAPGRCLIVFGMPASHSKILLHMRKEGGKSLNLKHADLDYHDKQNWAGVQRLFDFDVNSKTGEVKTKSTVRDAFKDDGDYYGLWMFLTLAHRFTGVFILKDRPVKEVLLDCGFCLAFLAYWKKGMTDIGVDTNIKENFLTSETFQDMVIALNSVVLMAKFFAMHHPTIKFDPSRLSSRFVEYMFQYLRIQGAGHNVKLSSLSALNKLRTYCAMLDMEGSNEVLPKEKSKRGMPKGKERVKADWNNQDTDYYPHEHQFMEAFNSGVSELQCLLKQSIDNGCVTYTPWDHFDQPDDIEAIAREYLLDVEKKADMQQWQDRFPSYKRQDDSGQPRTQLQIHSMPDEGEEGLPNPPDVDESIGCIAMPLLPSDVASDDEEQDVLDEDEDIITGAGIGGEIGGMHAHVTRRKDMLTKQEDTLVRARIAMESVMQAQDVDDGVTYDVMQSEEMDEKHTFNRLVRLTRADVSLINGQFGRQGTDRVAGRFMQFKLRDITEMAFASNEYYADDDFVAVMFSVKVTTRVNERQLTTNTDRLFFGVIEKCLYRSGNKVENISLVHCDDPKGEFKVRFLDPLMTADGKKQRRESGNNGRLQFELPLIAREGVSNKVTCENIVSVVRLDLSNRVYYLNRQDEKVVVSYFNKWTKAKSPAAKTNLQKEKPKGRIG